MHIEDIEIRVACSAHHEAGHIVIAATQGLRLRSEGLMVDRVGEGLACYFKEPDNNDGSREQVILATLAGFAAENRYRTDGSLPLRTDCEMIWSPDWKEARTVLCQLSATYLAGKSLDTVLLKLQKETETLVSANWTAIKRLASILLGKELQPFKPLKSGMQWSRENIGFCVAGDEAVTILQEFQIMATCS
jgi:hypothetical protein